MIKLVCLQPNLVYFNEAEDTPSIVSIKVNHPKTGLPMKKAELAQVFLAMTLDVSD